MALITKYYRLFEVRVLHEYFLISDEQLSYFDLPEADRSAQLESRLTHGQYDLLQDLSIEPDPATKAVLKNHRLKFIQTATGLTVVSGGKTKTIDGSEVLMPEIGIPENTHLNFVIKVNNSFFKNYTSLPLDGRRFGGYLFSNGSDSVNGVGFATLSRPALDFAEGDSYLAGDIADHGGTLKEAFASTRSEEYWDDIEGNGYVNENDRRWLGKSFFYYPEEADTSDPITFSLKNQAGDKIIKSITVEKPSLSGIRVDLRMSKVEGGTMETPIPDGTYRLQIQSDSGETEEEIFLSDTFGRSHLGLIRINCSGTGPYQVLSEQGGIQTPHPVFEIRLRSRKTFWRYQARYNGKKLEPVGTAQFFRNELNEDSQNAVPARQLITRKPQKLARFPIQIVDQDGFKETFPQPSPSPLKVKSSSELVPR